jgi:hypothetical protein
MISLPKEHLDGVDSVPLDPGRYGFLIRDTRVANDERGNPEFLEVRCRVEDGPPGCQFLGGMFVERFGLGEASHWRLGILLKRLGLKARGEEGDLLEFDERDLIGHRVIADVIIDEYPSKKSGKMVRAPRWEKNKFWAGDDPRALAAGTQPPAPASAGRPVGGVLPQQGPQTFDEVSGNIEDDGF